MCMNDTVGEAIRRIRISNGMTQEAMAELMESGLRNYQNIEAGKAWPNYKMIANLVERLHIDPALLFTNKASIEQTNRKKQIDLLLNQLHEDELNLVYHIIKDILDFSRKDLPSHKEK